MSAIASLLLVLSMSQAAAPAATGGIGGRVTVEGTNAPIAGARVMIFPMGRPATPPTVPMMQNPQTATDLDGRFGLSLVGRGEYLIDVTITGFDNSVEP